MNKKKKLELFLKNYWNSSSINSGDTILLHSNALRLLKECFKRDSKFNVKLILSSLLKKIGSKGTLIVPTFTFQFIKKKFFDIKVTPSETGLISELVRKSKNSVRTGHPIYSFSVLGKNKKLFRNIDNEDAFSNESPFQIMHDLNCKIVILDLPDSQCMTFYHHIEQMNNVKYRQTKFFLGRYKDQKNKITKKFYTVFVRNLKKNIVTDVDRAGKYLWKNKVFTGDLPLLKSGIRVAKVKEVFKSISNIIKANKAKKYLYSIKKVKN